MSGIVQPGHYVDRARVQALSAQMLQRDRWPRARLLESLKRAIAVELDEAGAILDDLTVEAVAAIERTGTGAKQKAVGVFA